ncbi:MAG: hypothetical protein ACJA2M_002012, partial [Polaribacter sp.]
MATSEFLKEIIRVQKLQFSTDNMYSKLFLPNFFQHQKNLESLLTSTILKQE